MLDASVDERGLIFINGTRYAEKMSRMEVRDNAKNLMEDAYSAGGIAHDFNNLLSVILLQVERGHCARFASPTL